MDKKNNNARKGHPQSKATREKISKSETGRHLSQETKDKISKSMMGNNNGHGNKRS